MINNTTNRRTFIATVAAGVAATGCANMSGAGWTTLVDGPTMTNLNGFTELGAGGWSQGGAAVAEIRHVVTDHRQQRQGIGRALMVRIFADAGAAGATSFTCKATRTAVPFYRAMGFVVLGEIEVPLAPGISFPAVAMQRAG